MTTKRFLDAPKLTTCGVYDNSQPDLAYDYKQRSAMTAKPSPDTATLVESFRVKLGLKPWHEQEQLMRERLGDEFADGRRTGRTTRTILAALAHASIHPSDRVILSCESSFVPMLRDTVRSIALRLNLETHRVEVVTHSKADEIYRGPVRDPSTRRLGPPKFFSDHHDPQYDAALALVQLRDARRA